MSKDLPTPKIGQRVVSVYFTNLGRRGRRLEGYTDPSHRMVWVKWDDGEVSGEFLNSLVRESDYSKTMAYNLLKDD